MQLSLRHKLSIGICVFAVILIGSFLLMIHVSITRAAERKVREDLLFADGVFNTYQRLRFEQLLIDAGILAETVRLKAVVGTPGINHATLLDSAQSAQDISNSDILMLSDDKGRLLASVTEPERFGDDVSDHPGFASALKGAAFRGMWVDEPKQAIYQVVAWPIAYGDQLVGALVMGYEIDQVLINRLEQMTRCRIALSSGVNLLTAASSKDLFNRLHTEMREDDPGAVVVDPLRDGATRIADVQIAGERYALRLGPFGEGQVSYVLARSVDEELASYRLLQRELLVVGFMLLLLGLVAGLLLLRRLTEPIQTLVMATMRISAGDLKTQIVPTSKDEIGELAKEFERMRGSIRDRTEELEREIAKVWRAEHAINQLNANLEQSVHSLEAANKELEGFSYSVSHDLRAPLRAIDGFSNMVLEDYAAVVDDEGKRLLRVIRSNAQKMAQLIDDLLMFSRMGRKELQSTAIDMNALISDVLRELLPQTEGRSLEIKAGPLPAGRGDRILIRQVWVNLLSNAIKYTLKKNKATIEIGAGTEGDQHVYYVKDNGAGFDMKYVGKLFGVFQRLHGSEEFEGTGVGLAIVQRIIHRHGGRVWAEGQIDEGATFYFTLSKF